ncbi:5107_t:CDS:2 [Acaulospora colombiana]|uniref:5107_t:CDS:1 n=1 Tax=Acaulospora colombiana TaxID=27376 RepID=A0ACA9MD29_9GLOM|nr:5107_t:CDS:2 [Acaulospora colombiana]
MYDDRAEPNSSPPYVPPKSLEDIETDEMEEEIFDWYNLSEVGVTSTDVSQGVESHAARNSESSNPEATVARKSLDFGSANDDVRVIKTANRASGLRDKEKRIRKPRLNNSNDSDNHATNINHVEPKGQNWSKNIRRIESVERDACNRLVVYVLWKSGERTIHLNERLRKRAPQKVHSENDNFNNRPNYYSNGQNSKHNSRGGTFNKKFHNFGRPQNNVNSNNFHHYYQPQHIEFCLSSIGIDEYHESVEAVDVYKLKFRYKYLEEGISIFLNGNKGKIYIPLEALEEISKVQLNLIFLTLKKDAKKLITYNSRDGFSRDDPIRENLGSQYLREYTPYIAYMPSYITDFELTDRATEIHVYAQESTPQQAIDMTGLHINYVLDKINRIKLCKTQVPNWGGGVVDVTPRVQGKFIIKCHVGDDIRILSFDPRELTNDFKYIIEDAFNVSGIRNVRYKDDDGDYISIFNTDDLETAVKLYQRDNKLEIWCN